MKLLKYYQGGFPQSEATSSPTKILSAMNIDPLSNSSDIAAFFRRRAAFQENNPASNGDGGDQLATTRSSSVRDTLAALPEVRPEVVERGRQLLADPNYPGADVVQKIASLITPLSED